MPIKPSNQIKTDSINWKNVELDPKISNTSPVITPDTLNFVFSELLLVIQDLIESSHNKVDGIAIANITGLVATLAAKENADATILRQAQIVNNLLSTSAIQPLSANQGKILKDLIDAIHAPNTDTTLDQGNANEISALELRTHVDDTTKHFTQSQIDHTVILNRGSNTHAQIDSHIADVTLHYPQSAISHLNIQDTGTNTHLQIDAHISSTLNPHSTTLNQVITASGLSFAKGNLYVSNGVSIQALPAPLTNGLTLKSNSAEVTGLEWSTDNGEANTISSVGTGVSAVQGKTGVDLRVKSFSSSSPTIITVTDAGTEVQFGINISNINHQLLSGTGTNTHSQIDAHIANTSNPHNVTITQVSPTTTKGDIMVDNGGTVVRFPVGANGQVLVADSSTATGLAYSSGLIAATSHVSNTSNPHGTTISQTITAAGLPLTKGTIYVSDGTNVASLAVGANGTVIKANNATLTGLEWAADSGEINTASNLAGSGVGFYASKSGADLRFRTLNPASPSLTFTINGNQIDAALVPSLINHQDLNGAGTNTHAQIDNHIANTANPHNVTKAQIGLSLVPNVDATFCDNHINGVNNFVFTAAERTKLQGVATAATSNPVQTAITASLTSLVQTGNATTPDFNIAPMVNGGWGFATQDEAETVLQVIVNMQTRINQLQARLQAANILLP